MRLICLSSLLLLAACNKDNSDDVNPETGDTTTDTGDTEIIDNDEDGYAADVDCNDEDASIHPDAEEICDEIDNNCNDEIDEGFDADADGHYSLADCAFGTDCDDSDATINPDAEDIPYDGIDQDCSGADSADTDGDGYDASEAGGEDCDDSNPDINPDAEDIPKNGVDEDCDGEDNIDGDGDGFGDESLGGTDCNDEDATVNPDATDWLNDGIDSNCDGPDGDEVDITTISASIIGSITAQGVPSYAGYEVALCDLDADGLGDVVAAAPFADDYNGQVGIFYGSNSASWAPGMTLDSADTIIGGNDYDFIGWSLDCGDHNGDGYEDLAVVTGEIVYAALSMDKATRVLVYYGTGAKMSGSLGDDDADFVLNAAMGVPDAGTVYSSTAKLHDLDGDGAEEILMLHGNEVASLFDGEQRALVIPGGNNSGEIDLADIGGWGLSSDQPYSMSFMSGTDDLDGDGTAELLIGSMSYSTDYASDPYTNEGAVHVLTQAPASPSWDIDLYASASSAYIGSSESSLLGYNFIEDDFDGDGITDLVSTAVTDATGATDAGALYIFNNAGDDFSNASNDAAATCDGQIYSNDSNGLLGFDTAAVGDINGNGVNDLLVTELYGGVSGTGFVWLVDGLALWSNSEISDVAMYGWYSDSVIDMGRVLAGGHDIDGDGINDMIVGTLGYDSGAGRIEILLSSDL